MRHYLLSAPVDALSLRETLERIDQAIRERRKLLHVSMNVAKLVKMRSDAELRRDVESADIVGIDGMGIVLGMKILGLPPAERVAGVDLMHAVLELCAAKGYRPFFLGAKPEVVEAAGRRAVAMHPALKLAGCRDGYFSSADEGAIVEEIEASSADCLFLGMPTPAKERFIARHGRRLPTPFIMGVGGSFDILAGNVRRAPLWLQKAGFEWAYRVYQEPRRMWRRYAVTNSQFGWLIAGELLSRRRRGRRRDSASGQPS